MVVPPTPAHKVDVYQDSGVAEEKLGDKQTDVNQERNELLASLGDPDEGLSEEERKKLDRKLMWKASGHMMCDEVTSLTIQLDRSMADPVAFATVSAFLPGPKYAILRLNLNSQADSAQQTLGMHVLQAWKQILTWKGRTTTCP
jgi:hypothetical protein